MPRSRRVAERLPAINCWRARERPEYDGPLLLDTHVWIWFLDGDATRLRGVLTLIQRAEAAGTLYVCDVSYWEVALKSAKGKLSLSTDAIVWLHRAERAPGVRSVPLSRAILIQSTRLPGTLHGDPADRMLIAAAQVLGVPLMTADDAIVAYARRERSVLVCDARP